MDRPRVGSRGEHLLQERFGTTKRAGAFYRQQMLDHVNPEMKAFIARMDMVFISTADESGNCDCSFRAGPVGFIRVIDDRCVAYPEYRGNGVMASQGNIAGNGRIGLLLIDFFDSTIGLHVNGRAHLQEAQSFGQRFPDAWQPSDGPQPERWVVVDVEEAYIHCSKHVPLMRKLDKDIVWGTDDRKLKGGDYFRVSARRRRLVRDDDLPSPSHQS